MDSNLTNINISIFGSCRQNSLKDYYNVTSIHEKLTYPHYTKEIIQAMEYCKGLTTFDNTLTQYCFRTGILEKTPINYQKELQKEFENTDLFVIEIASRISYEWNSMYVHHILTEEQYGFHDIQTIKQRELSDEEIEEDILKIKKLVYPKKMLIVPHNYTYAHGKRYNLISLLEKLTMKYNIPFINPGKLMNGVPGVYENEKALHYTNKGNIIIGYEYKKAIDKLFDRKTVLLVWKGQYSNYPRTKDGFFWGIGDMLRGAIGLFKLSKKYDFDIIVDKSLHPISKVLK
jgi:hypothetical protein